MITATFVQLLILSGMLGGIFGMLWLINKNLSKILLVLQLEAYKKEISEK